MLFPFSTSVPTGFNLIFVNLPAIDAKIGVTPTVNFLGELTEMVLLFFLLLLMLLSSFSQTKFSKSYRNPSGKRQ